MNRIAFHLKRPHAETTQAIFALYRFGKKQVKVYTGLSILPKFWHPQRQRVRSAARHAAIYNDRLDQIETDILNVVRDLQNAHIALTPERIKSRYEDLIRHNRQTDRKSVFDYWDNWLDATEKIKGTQTIKNYRSTLNHLKAFSKARGMTITFERMDRHFVNALIDYLLKVKQMTNATLWNFFKTWKAFMKWAVDLGITDNRFYESVTKKDFRVPEHRMLRLIESELQMIADCDFPAGGYLDNARNLFVLQCCLGVRFGDLERIVTNPDDYVDGNFIRLTTQKNHKAVMIPLLPTARRMLVERSVQIRPVSHQKFNSYVKEVAEKAGLTDTIVKTEYRGAQQTQITVRKCDEIASHTAKRTFVSLMIARGISAETIMKITGNTRATIDRYIILDEADVEREMLKAADLLTGTTLGESAERTNGEGKGRIGESTLPYRPSPPSLN